MGRKRNKRETILKAAEEIFAEKNFTGATMREIAKGADILKPGLYHYFRNKEEIYKTLILDIYDQLRRRVLDPIKRAPSTEKKLRLLATLLVDFWAEHPRFPRIIAQEVIWGSDLVFTELVPHFLVPMFKEIMASIDESDLVKQGFRKVDMPLLVFNIFGMSIFYFFSGSIFTTLTGEESFSPEKIARLKEEVVSMVFQGVKQP